jgi:predicted uridylate kinase
LIGDPVEHSISPIIHNEVFRALNLNYVYLAFKVPPENLVDAVKGLKALGVVGFNVTIPHKVSVMRYLDELSPDAEVVGSVNTVVNRGSTARHYISMARRLGVNESWSDLLGINISRINALLLNALLGDITYNYIPRNVDEVLTAWSSGKVVTLGGLQPGQSTNAVAMIIAELVGADLVVNATDVDGVYDKDPKKYSDAKLL